MSFRKKLFFIILSLVLLTSAIAFFYMRYVTTSYIEKRVGVLNMRTTNMIAMQVNHVLTHFDSQAHYLMQHSFQMLQNEEQVKEAAQTVVSKSIFPLSICYITSNRVLLFTKHEGPKTLTLQEKHLYRRAKANGIYRDIHIDPALGDTVFSVVFPLDSLKNTSAVLAFNYSARKIYFPLQNGRRMETGGSIFLVNRKGQIISPLPTDSTAIFHKTISLNIIDVSGSQVAFNGRSFIYTNFAGERVLGSIKPIPLLKGWLFNEADYSKIMQPKSMLTEALLWLFLFLMTVLAIAVFYIAGHITKPIKILKQGINRIERGELDFQIEPLANDEIGDLARSFEKMRQNIRLSENKMKRHAEDLELKVQERTRQLDEKIALLEAQKNESQNLAGELERTNQALQDEIAEREKITAVLKENEMRYRIVSELSSDYAYGLLVEENGNLKNMWTAGAFEQMTGYKNKDIEGKGGWEFLIHPDDMAIALRQVGVFLSGKPSVSEYRIVTKSGEIRWVRDYGRPEWDAELQRVTYIYGAIQDITQQRNAEDRLRQSEASYRELFDSTLDAIYIQDKNGVFLAVNHGAELMYGYPKEFFIGKTPEVISAPGKNDLDHLVQLINLAANGEPQQFEFWGKRKNGDIFPKEVRIHKGTYFGQEAIVAFAQDISKRRENEQRLRILSQTVEQSPVQVVLTDTNRVIEYVNKRFTEVTGFTLDEVTGKTPDFLRIKHEGPKLYEQLWNTIQQGQIWQGEITSHKKTGEKIYQDVTASPLFDEKGNISFYIAFLIEITERKKLEEEFRQSQKMEAIGRLAGGIAHDFNNLLTVIIGYSELMLAQISKKDPLYNRIQQIDKAGRRAESLTRQLLAFSRKQILQPKVLNLNQMISDMEKMLRRLIGEHIELQTDLSDELGNIKADPGQIEQVIMNLSINARDAMPEGGNLTISTEIFRHTEETIVPNWEEMPFGSYIRLNISDTGIGMDEEVKARIFEPFFTTKEKGKGTGLGLSTVYGIIKQSKGFIFVHSEKDRGTTFQIFFPQVTDQEAGEQESSEHIAELKGTETILLVEDEDSLRALALETLENAGYKVLTSEDGEQAITLALNYNNNIDLLLTDVVMPKLSGKKLAKAIKKIHPEILVLYMSGYTEDAIVHQGVLDHNTEFLPKPFKPTSLLKKIRSMLDAVTE